MKDQHTKIKGYRDLTQEEIDAMNNIKELAEIINNKLNELKGIPGIDQRWLAVGTTDLQKGFMAVVRSIARPTTF